MKSFSSCQVHGWSLAHSQTPVNTARLLVHYIVCFRWYSLCLPTEAELPWMAGYNQHWPIGTAI